MSGGHSIDVKDGERAVAVLAISTCAYPDLPLAVALERIATLVTAAEVRCKGRHGIETVAQRRTVAGCGLRCSVHAPEQIEIWSSDERRRRAAIAAHVRLLEICTDTQAELYVVHPDYSELPITRRAETRAALEASFADLRELERIYPVRIAVENMPGLHSSHVVAPGFPLAGLAWALDAGHALTNGTLEAFLDEADIAHLHLHDNRGFGASDSHLTVGRGCLTPQLVQRLLESCEGFCVLEHSGEAQVLESLDFLSRLQLRREVA